jgi:hypothetical protein
VNLFERILRCTCTNEKTMVDCDHRFQHSFDLKQVCIQCAPELYHDNGRRGREPVNGETAKADWMKAGTGVDSPTSPQRADTQATAAAGSNPAAAHPSKGAEK